MKPPAPYDVSHFPWPRIPGDVQPAVWGAGYPSSSVLADSLNKCPVVSFYEMVNESMMLEYPCCFTCCVEHALLHAWALEWLPASCFRGFALKATSGSQSKPECIGEGAVPSIHGCGCQNRFWHHGVGAPWGLRCSLRVRDFDPWPHRCGGPLNS